MADTGTITAQPPKYATLWLALAAAQEAMPELLKQKVVTKSGQSKSGNTFSMSFKYAPLDVVLGVVRPALQKHGLALTQPTRVEGDWLFVETRITHAETGEHTASVYPVGQIAKVHPDLGAALTFARRYSLMSLCGIFPEGEDAPKPEKRQQREPQQADLTQPAAALRVKLTGAVSMADLVRIWNSNRKLLETLDDQNPQERVRLGELYDQRVFEFNERGAA